MIFKSENAQGDLNGFLDAGSHMQGELHFEDTFRVDGKLTGKVFSKGDLVVGERGEIEGEMEVGRIFVSGRVSGKVKAFRRIEVTAGGELRADLETPSLVLEDGAFYEGNCSMRRASRKAPSAEDAPPRPGVVRQMPAP